MCLSKRVGLATGAAALTLTMAGGTYAGPVDTSDDDLRSRLAAAEARLAELEAENGDNWLTEQRSDEIRGLVQDVLADADTRASLLGSGVSAGYDDGFVLGSTDGNWLLRINGQIQARYIYNMADRSDEPGSFNDTFDENRNGFELARTKLIFSGNVVNPDWTYKIEGNFSQQDAVNFSEGEIDTTNPGLTEDALEQLGYSGVGSSTDFDDSSSFFGGKFCLEDAWIHYNYGNGWGIKIGQFKSPFLREELINSGYQLAVERSLLNEVYTLGRTQGIMVDYQGDQWRMMAAYSDGSNTANASWAAEDTEWAFTARGEWMLSGNWEQFNDLTSFAGDESGMLVGVAVNYERSEFGTGNNGAVPNNNELINLGITADLQWEFGGANLYGAFIYRDIDGDTAGFDDMQQYGFVVQGGWMLNDDWELYARYEWSDYDISGFEDLSVVTVGVNRYFAGNSLKWSTDVLFALEELDFGSDLTGLRVDDVNEDGQIAIRTQLQLLF